MDIAEFRKRGREIVDTIAEYYKGLADMPPCPTVEPGFLYKTMPLEAPENPESFDRIQQNIKSKIMPGVMHWQSANFFAWFPSTSSLPSILGEMYTAMFDAAQFSWASLPAAAELETVVVDWLAKLIGLDGRFLSIREDGAEGGGGGVIQGSATEALVVSMVAARERALDRLRAQGASETEVDAARPKLVAYFSDQTHSAGEKSVKLLGCRPHCIPTDSDFRITRATLLDAVESDRAAGLIPFFVCGTFGTTNTTAIDDLPGIADAARDEQLWFHVDAAYAGAALCCPEFRALARGIERADSLSFSPHKWMLTTVECTAMWVANSAHLARTLSIQREYLPRTEDAGAFVRDYHNWQIPLGRRFRALKLWMVVRAFGASGIRATIRRHVNMAKRFEEQLVADGRFEIVAPVVFGLVVFRIKPGCLGDGGEEVANRANAELVRRINADGRVFLLGPCVKGTSVVRAAIGATQSTHANVSLLLDITKAATDAILLQTP
ncbi:hypothetical protein H4R18_005599 [Coemansia javaensis]|uniref:Aromatic-L-amino-acid decarboxylase n=1 Tax=Coemansia javaensis TaxID=2761396 RepID=A0A9W8H5U3_9FUNG|nr:hypothetical protein H4R18_005599 [Coemansia javaensis]